DGEAGLAEALRLMISGRALTAEQALGVGLVDEIVKDEGLSPQAVAMAHARAFALKEGAVTAALAQKTERRANREEPVAAVQGALNDVAVQSAIRQANNGGRSKSVERILEAVKIGLIQGQSKGLVREGELFAEAVCDAEAGPPGIRAFLERRSAPLPLKRAAVAPLVSAQTRTALEAQGRLLPLDGAFYPGATPIPELMYAMSVVKSEETGAPLHGDPKDVELLTVVETPKPGPNEALVYMLVSEVNFNDIWAITGIPITPFDARDADVHWTGSGGLGLVAALGSELVREGRISLGQMVTLYSGQSEVLSPDMGLDPMAADFRIQGYERNDGTHAQFAVVQGPQLHPKLPGLTLEEAGSYGLNLGTIHRALHTTLKIEAGKRLFVEGAATGTGLECLRTAKQTGLSVVGMVSSEERERRVRSYGGEAVNRKDERWSSIFTPVPDDPEQVAEWQAAGKPFVDDVYAKAGGPIDLVVSHAGERAFSRSFQLLGDQGVLTFFGASSGYRFSFVGKTGTAPAEAMLKKGGLRAGRALMVMYGPGAADGIVDPVAIEAIEVGCAMKARVVVLTDTVSQREFVASLGFGANFSGVTSVEELRRK
ncbi:MAG: hypothetical protein AAFV29_11940, partial [Myxococcota bacterium]